MSLHRLALRLAAVEALRGVTIAGRLVYDSRQAALDELGTRPEPRPVLVVYTEDERVEPEGQARHPATVPVISLVVEAMIAARGQVMVQAPDGSTETVGALDVALTDKRHEALLDLLDAQVRRALDPRSYTDAGAPYRRVAMETRAIESVPLRDADGEVRLALRTIALTIRTHATAWPAPDFAGPAAEGLDRLPEPLRGVALALPPNSEAGTLCALIAGLVAPSPTLTPIEQMAGFVSLDPAAPPDDDAPVRFSVPNAPA
ncbi:hypothetical protein SAMN02745172_02466 [Pseudoxanthobacter soli DSM 19599]|uniref:Uncharacterized protein n=1 Tax=Pseudoxanthobacter soli DSM 19599 TaxID=1123029 RepID=A0A1M7ZLY8_9HYPH|nr:hypothetical protein [Pseudoxanthobacter soli]SHO65819.1 hypothetical protein SAMN02745172_02466 [Pseudoxanthobacter soli DSM 19599]